MTLRRFGGLVSSSSGERSVMTLRRVLGSVSSSRKALMPTPSRAPAAGPRGDSSSGLHLCAQRRGSVPWRGCSVEALSGGGRAAAPPKSPAALGDGRGACLYTLVVLFGAPRRKTGNPGGALDGRGSRGDGDVQRSYGGSRGDGRRAGELWRPTGGVAAPATCREATGELRRRRRVEKLRRQSEKQRGVAATLGEGAAKMRGFAANPVKSMVARPRTTVCRALSRSDHLHQEMNEVRSQALILASMQTIR